MASYQFSPIEILDTTNATSVSSGGALQVDGGASIRKNVFVGGNLSVSGTTTSFADNILVINGNPSDSVDTGLLFGRYSPDIQNNDNYSAIIYSESADVFQFGYAEADIRGTISLTHLAPVRAATGLFTKVGINTTEMGSSYALNVNGDINLTGDILQNGVIFSGGGGGGFVSGTIASAEIVSLTSGNFVATSGTFGNLMATVINASGDSNTIGSIITTGGNVGIGTSDPLYPLHVDGNIYSSGEITILSDARYKTDIVKIPDALNKVKALNGVTYTRVDSPVKQRHIGLLAQEVERQFPELVYTEAMTGHKSVAYANFVAVLLECIKELDEKVNKLLQ